MKILWDVWILAYGAVNIPPWLVLEVAEGHWDRRRVSLTRVLRALFDGRSR